MDCAHQGKQLGPHSQLKALQALVSVSTIGAFEGRSDDSLAEEVKGELQPWFGSSVADWKLLRNYRIPYAQPNQVSLDLSLHAISSLSQS